MIKGEKSMESTKISAGTMSKSEGGKQKLHKLEKIENVAE